MVFELVFLDICNRSRESFGIEVRDEANEFYGRLKSGYHLQRHKELRRVDFTGFVQALRNLLDNHLAHLNVQPGTCEVVVAAFMQAAHGQRPERDFEVLGSFDEESAKRVHQALKTEFLNWEPSAHPAPIEPSTSRASSPKESPQPQEVFTGQQEPKQDVFPENIYENFVPYCTIYQGKAGSFGTNYSPRMKYICDFLNAYRIQYFVDSFQKVDRWFHNIVIPGTSDQIFTAHHDTAEKIDARTRKPYNMQAANDNASSVINLLALKIARPSAYIVLTDAEELGPSGAYGAKRVAEIWNASKNGAPMTVAGQVLDWSNMKWIVNLELTGSGGANFFYGAYYEKRKAGTPNLLAGQIHRLFDQQYPVPQVEPPFCDTYIFAQHGIDSVVLNPLPEFTGQYRVEHGPRQTFRAANGTQMDFSIVALCNTPQDVWGYPWLTTTDMKEFVEKVLCRLADIC